MTSTININNIKFVFSFICFLFELIINELYIYFGYYFSDIFNVKHHNKEVCIFVFYIYMLLTFNESNWQC